MFGANLVMFLAQICEELLRRKTGFPRILSQNDQKESILRFATCLECNMCRGLDSLQPQTRRLIKLKKMRIYWLHFNICIDKSRLDFMLCIGPIAPFICEIAFVIRN